MAWAILFTVLLFGCSPPFSSSDTTVQLPAKGGTQTARPWWTYVRDDRPFAGGNPPAALFPFSRDRGMANPNRYLAGWQGILQADSYGGNNDLYRADRDSGSVESALCWSHARRKFFKIADIKGNARKASPPMTSPLSRWRLWPGSTRTSISNAPSMARPPWNGWRRDRSRAHGSICT